MIGEKVRRERRWASVGKAGNRLIVTVEDLARLTLLFGLQEALLLGVLPRDEERTRTPHRERFDGCWNHPLGYYRVLVAGIAKFPLPHVAT